MPPSIQETWFQWRSELHLLAEKYIPRCYFGKSSNITSIELHGFCDASELAYAAMVYLRLPTNHDEIQISLVASKTKVAPIKRLTIPRLELCGAHLLAQLLHHVRQVLDIPISQVYAWTDSTIVLNWLDGSPKCFKTYVGNRISTIMELLPPDKWKHVKGLDNPADCASRGLFPSELVEHPLWWSGPTWLKQSPDDWPTQSPLPPNESSEEEREISLFAITPEVSPVISLDRYSNFNRLKIVGVSLHVDNCRKGNVQDRVLSSLSNTELYKAEQYWVRILQLAHFEDAIQCLRKESPLNSSNPLLPLNPFVDSADILRVGGRRQLSKSSYESLHPMILHGKHPLTKLIIRTEHARLLSPVDITLLEIIRSGMCHLLSQLSKTSATNARTAPS